ncbi:MAG: glycosyltransferase, partial [Acidimicrobiales bacterium]
MVLCHYMLTGLRCLDSCRRARIPMIIHCHGYDAHTTFAKKQWIDAVHEIGEYAHKIIAVSNTMIAALKEAGFPSEKIIHRPYGIDLERFGFSSRKSTKPVFTSVGRFIDKKAPHLLLMAFRKVLEQRPDARLEMIGDGPLLSPCYDLISEWNMQHAIDLAGVLPPSEVAERLRCSRAFVQHSISPKVGFLEGDHEGTPVAILEAAASGLPIVATR